MKVIKFAPGLIPVLKHQEHDQSSHGSWANGTNVWSVTDGKNEKIFSTKDGTLKVKIANSFMSNPEYKETIKKTLDTVEKLQGDFPIKGEIYFQEGDFVTGTNNAWATTMNVSEGGRTSSQMTLTEGLLKPTARKDFLVYTITHEWGHAIDRRSSERALQAIQSIARSENAPMTKYGFRNGREAFAEAFAVKYLRSHEGGILSEDVPQDPKWERTFNILEVPSVVSKAIDEKGFSFFVADTFDPNNPPILIEDYKPPVLKHGNHDQSSHGNWAEGSQGSVRELSDDEYKDILYTSKTVEQAYAVIAKRLGKDMKAKVADLSPDEINMYRGVPDVERDTKRLLDGKIRYTEFQTWGQGIYVAPDKETARNYGTPLELKLDDSANILRGEMKWESAFDVEWNNPSARVSWSSNFLESSKIKMNPNDNGIPNYSISDLKNLYWASKGYDGFSPHGGEMVLFNGGKLTISKDNPTVQKHLSGQHDQSTHGRWADSGLPHELEDIKGSLQKYIEAGLIANKNEVMGSRRRYQRNPETGETEYVTIREKTGSSLGKDYSYREPDESVDPEGYKIFKEAESKMLGGNAEEIELMARQEAIDAGMGSRQALYYGQAMLSRASIYVNMENAIIMGEAVRKVYSRDVSDYEEKGHREFFEIQEKTIKTMGENISKSVPVVAIETDDFLGVIKDGRFKTQYETRESNGAYKPALRREAELALSGIPLDTKSSERPIYGYLALQESGETPNTSGYNSDRWNFDNGGVGQYGEVRVVLKDEVRERTSYTSIDSLDRYGIPQPLSKTSKNDLIRSGVYQDLTASHGGYQRESYTEAQVYGGVKLSDIKAVYVTQSSDYDPNTNTFVPKNTDAQAESIRSAFSAKGLDIPVKVLAPRKKGK